MIKVAQLLFLGAVVFFGLKLSGFEPSFCQLGAFPFVLWAAWKFSLNNVGLPRGMLVACAILAVAGVGFSKSYKLEDEKSFMIASFAGDQYEAISRSFRTKLNAYLQVHGKVRARRFPEIIKNQAEAVAVIMESPVLATVWGVSKWINVSLPPLAPKKIKEVVEPAMLSAFPPQLLEMQLVRSVPGFGLSRLPEDASVQFLSELFLGLSGDTPELRYTRASQIIGRWVNFAHRAMPMWQLGNLNLLAGLKKLEISEIRCAITHYRAGQKFISYSRESPSLYAATLNNLAVATFLKASLEGEKNTKKITLKLLRLAMNTKMPADPYDSAFEVWRIAKANMKSIKKLGRSVKRAKNGKKKKIRKKKRSKRVH